MYIHIPLLSLPFMFSLVLCLGADRGVVHSCFCNAKFSVIVLVARCWCIRVFARVKIYLVLIIVLICKDYVG